MTGRIYVLCGSEPRMREAFSGLTDCSITFAAQTDAIPESAECAVISQEFAGEALDSTVAVLKRRQLTVAVASFAAPEQAQDALADCGADDIIFLPLSGKLLEKRLKLLSGSASVRNEPLNFDAFDHIHEANQGRGAFLVEERDFTTVFRFLSRILERLDKKAQMVIFQFESPCGPIEISEDIRNFTRIVQACLRRGDISAVCGMQVLLILVGTNAEDAHRVIRRLTDTFAAHYYDSCSRITYEMRELNS